MTGPARTARWLLLGLGAIVLVAIGVSIAGALDSRDSVDPNRTRLEAAGELGIDPFAPDLRLVDEIAPTSQLGLSSAEIDGRASGVWQPAEDACDKATLLETLQANDQRNAAWRSVFNLAESDVSEFIDRLNPVTLAQDSVVMNHGFIEGRAAPVRTILQAGTIVLADGFGVPRVLCKCGNPLLTAGPVAMEDPIGKPWADFDAKRVISLVAVDEPPAPTATAAPTTAPDPTPTVVSTPTATPTPRPTATPTPPPTLVPEVQAPPPPLPPTVTPQPVSTPTPTTAPEPLVPTCVVSPSVLAVGTEFTVTVDWTPSDLSLDVVISTSERDLRIGGGSTPPVSASGVIASPAELAGPIEYLLTDSSGNQPRGICPHTPLANPPECPANRLLDNGECCPPGQVAFGNTCDTT